MTNRNASNSLYWGEYDGGNPINALDAVIQELKDEASFAMNEHDGFATPDDLDLQFGQELSERAKEIEKIKTMIIEAYSKIDKEFSEKIRAEQLAGNMSDGIADCLLDGAWHRLAI